jgi:hypothetical protein
MLQYTPLAHHDYELAVTVAETDGVASSLTIYFRTRVSLVDPLASASSISEEILSAAGLSEDYALSDFHLASQTTRGSYYYYAVTCAVTA